MPRSTFADLKRGLAYFTVRVTAVAIFVVPDVPSTVTR